MSDKIHDDYQRIVQHTIAAGLEHYGTSAEGMARSIAYAVLLTLDNLPDPEQRSNVRDRFLRIMLQQVFPEVCEEMMEGATPDMLHDRGRMQ